MKWVVMLTTFVATVVLLSLFGISGCWVIGQWLAN